MLSSFTVSTYSELAKFDCTMNDINFEVKLGDITCEKCDAIVNSTNYKLNVSIGKFDIQLPLFSQW